MLRQALGNGALLMNRIEQWAAQNSNGGLLLLFTLIAALLVANSPYYYIYDVILDMPIQIWLGSFGLAKPTLLWINEGLMAIFFMQLALEMKREVLSGYLRNYHQCVLPVCAAIGGIAVPVTVYFVINYSSRTFAGWPIVTTTDIAFVLGIVGLLGNRVPASLVLFLIALSIIDDILAVFIIAISYSERLSLTALSLAGVALIALVLLKRAKVASNGPYLFIGALMWICVVESGVHATLAGIITALFIPLHVPGHVDYSPLRNLENSLRPWLTCLILPLFVFANGGVIWHGASITTLSATIPLGITLGLFLGKTLGTFISSVLIIKLTSITLPANCNWRQLFGGCALTGIGFTMSLFFAALSFYNTAYENLARQSVLIGSFLSCLLGIACLLKRSVKA